MLAARRTSTFTESVIREMTRIAQMHEAVNLAQGFPDFPMPEPMKDAACAAIQGNLNQYAVTWGSANLRIGIAEKYRRWYGMEVDPDREVTVTCGATEAMAAVFMALMDPGDEVVVLEPFYENYGPDAILAGATPVFVPFERPNWTLDGDRLKKAVVGSGAATKEQVQFMLTRLLRLKAVPQPSDAADGVAAALAYVMSAHLPALDAARKAPERVDRSRRDAAVARALARLEANRAGGGRDS